MAEGKKSFVLYVDQAEVFNDLSNEEAGQLIKHIFSYVSDQNPPPLKDRVLKMAFIPIQQTLKRDLQKFRARAERSRINGAKGGRPTDNPPKPTKPTRLNSNPEEPRKPDSVNVNVNDSVNDNGNVILSIKELETELLNSPFWKESAVMANRKKGLSMVNINYAIKEFAANQAARGETKLPLKVAKKMFSSYLDFKAEEILTPTQTKRKRQQI